MNNYKQFLSYLLKILLLNNQLNEPVIDEGLEPTRRIINGYECQQGWFPFMVSLHRGAHESGSLCVGAILTNTWILTAGHCLNNNDPYYLYVMAGSHNWYTCDSTAQSSYAKRTVIHPRFNQDKSSPTYSREFDIALIELATPLSLNQFVQPVNLPPHGTIPTGWSYIVGYGLSNGVAKTLPHKLLYAYVPILPYTQCSSIYLPDITPNNICAGTSDQTGCLGDSGASLFQYNNGAYYVIGIAVLSVPYCNEPTEYLSVSACVSDFIIPTINGY